MRDIIKCDIFHKSDDSYKWADNIREQQNFPVCSSVYLMLIISPRLWWVWCLFYWHCAAELALPTQEVISLFYPKPTNSKCHPLGQNSFPCETVPSRGWTQPALSPACNFRFRVTFWPFGRKRQSLKPMCVLGDTSQMRPFIKFYLRTKMGRSWSSKIQIVFVSKQDVL